MLTHTQVERAKYTKGGKNRLWDGLGNGLFVQLSPRSKLWRMKFTLDGRESTFAMGKFPSVGLQEAREACVAARVLITKGINPARAKRLAALQRATDAQATFKAVAEEWIEDKRAKGRSESYCRQIEGIFKHHVYPSLGSMGVRDINLAMVHRLLRNIERGARLRKNTKAKTSLRTPTARFARQWCSQVFQYAISTGRASLNPTTQLEEKMFEHRATSKTPLREHEIVRFLADLTKAPVERSTAIALELLLLLWSRPGELRGARWSEFSLDCSEPLWVIPAHRMKMRTEHKVPLSPAAVELLQELRSMRARETDLLFPNRRRPTASMSATTLNRALERMGYAGQFSAHGFRATGSTAMNGRDYPSDWIEFQLAHQERNASRRPYQRGDFLAQRRSMMDQWAALMAESRAGRPWPKRGSIALIHGTHTLQSEGASAPDLISAA